jgi:hypothetical protein
MIGSVNSITKNLVLPKNKDFDQSSSFFLSKIIIWVFSLYIIIVFNKVYYKQFQSGAE